MLSIINPALAAQFVSEADQIAKEVAKLAEAQLVLKQQVSDVEFAIRKLNDDGDPRVVGENLHVTLSCGCSISMSKDVAPRLRKSIELLGLKGIVVHMREHKNPAPENNIEYISGRLVDLEKNPEDWEHFDDGDRHGDCCTAVPHIPGFLEAVFDRR